MPDVGIGIVKDNGCLSFSDCDCCCSAVRTLAQVRSRGYSAKLFSNRPGKSYHLERYGRCFVVEHPPSDELSASNRRNGAMELHQG